MKSPKPSPEWRHAQHIRSVGQSDTFDKNVSPILARWCSVRGWNTAFKILFRKKHVKNEQDVIKLHSLHWDETWCNSLILNFWIYEPCEKDQRILNWRQTANRRRNTVQIQEWNDVTEMQVICRKLVLRVLNYEGTCFYEHNRELVGSRLPSNLKSAIVWSRPACVRPVFGPRLWLGSVCNA